MKTPQDKLHRLIGTMTPAEKRYFKQHYAFAENNLTRLFDFLNDLPEYDEEKVKANFPGLFAKNLKVYKIQLQELLLKSLVSHRNKKDVWSKIRNGLEEVDLLMEKQLHEFADERLEKVKQLCIRYEAFTYLIEVIRMEFRLHYVQIDKIGLSKVPLFAEWARSLAHIQSEYDLSKLSNELHDQSRNTEHTRLSNEELARLQDLLQSELLARESSALSFQSRLSRNVTLTTIYKMLNRPEEEEKYRHANVDLFKEQPRFRDIMPFTYLAVMRNYLNYNLRFQRVPLIYEIIREAEAFIDLHPHYHMLLIYFYYGELQCKYEIGHFDGIIEESETKIIKCIEKAEIEKERIALMCYLVFALTSIIRREFQTAFHYLQLSQRIPADTRAYFEELIFIIELINHFEAGDDFLIENQLNAYARRKKQNQEEEPFLKELLQLFKLLVKGEKQGRQFAKDLVERLPQLKGGRLYLVFEYYRLENWLVALAEKKTFAHVARQRALQPVIEKSGSSGARG